MLNAFLLLSNQIIPTTQFSSPSQLIWPPFPWVTMYFFSLQITSAFPPTSLTLSLWPFSLFHWENGSNQMGSLSSMKLLVSVLLHLISMLLRAASSLVHRTHLYLLSLQQPYPQIIKISPPGHFTSIETCCKICLKRTNKPLMICHCIALFPLIAKLYLHIIHAVSTSLTPFPSPTYSTVKLLPPPFH